MPSTLTLFDAVDEQRPVAVAPADFENCAQWSEFFGQWTTSGSSRVQIGYVGHDEAREVVALLDGLVLHSVFQPILSLSPFKVVAYEALIRAQSAQDGSPISPDVLFDQYGQSGRGILLDRLCRCIHLINFSKQCDDSASLYLNVATSHLQTLQQGKHGSFLSAMQALCAIAPGRIILEITETQFDDSQALFEIVHTFKSRGYHIAIDDFGARHSNFDRLWALTPDIVKIDRELLLQADGNPRVRKILPKLVEIIHDLEASVVCEGIETSQQRDLAQSAGVDLVQGFLFARPARLLHPSS